MAVRGPMDGHFMGFGRGGVVSENRYIYDKGLAIIVLGLLYYDHIWEHRKWQC